MRSPDHTPGGLFRKGNQAAKGAKTRNQQSAYEARRQLYATIDPEKQKKLWRKIYSMALKGSAPHAKIISDQLLGKAPVAVEVSHEGSTLQLSLSDIQIAVIEALGGDNDARRRIAEKFRQLAHKEIEGGSNGSEPE